MKFLSTGSILLSLLALGEAKSLRKDEGAPKRQRRLNADAINAAIEASLPTINEQLQAEIDDPGTIARVWHRSFDRLLFATY